MTIQSSRLISRDESAQMGWSALRRFHHVPSVLKGICELHGISDRHRKNAFKQASQIRFCLIQAREYRDASRAVSLSTRPLLLYYSAMSLALAQILFKGTGAQSLDAARGEHKHHGLTLHTPNVVKDSFDLTDVAKSLVARPMISGERRGTFELWHRYSRDEPLIGMVQTEYEGGGSSTNQGTILLHSPNERVGIVPEKGINLLDCLQRIPQMSHHLMAFGIPPITIRGQVRMTHKMNKQRIYYFIIHPHSNPQRLSDLMDAIQMPAGLVDKVVGIEYQNGFQIAVRLDEEDDLSIILPSYAVESNTEVRFMPEDTVMNEFGHIYVALYILGNYARYFPDRWMNDVESGSPLAVATENLLEIAESRISLLTLSELSRVSHIIRS